MNDVRLPIETIREGDKITKICVEDVYKMVNKVQDAMNKAYNESSEILEEIKKKYWPGNQPNTVYDGYLIVGKGVSQPCAEDTFDATVGNDIAFMKAKLNANFKKYRVLNRILMKYVKAFGPIYDELDKIQDYITKDIDGIRKYNPNYLEQFDEV
jgi:hypothetical protein